MLPVAASLFDKALALDEGAITIILILVGIVLGIVWALAIRDPSVHRKKYK